MKNIPYLFNGTHKILILIGEGKGSDFVSDKCPFCGRNHEHVLNHEMEHRVAHCINGNPVQASDGSILEPKKGYYIAEREFFEKTGYRGF